MAELSERLQKLTEALRPLHLALTKETQVAYERQHGPVHGLKTLLCSGETSWRLERKAPPRYGARVQASVQEELSPAL